MGNLLCTLRAKKIEIEGLGTAHLMRSLFKPYDYGCQWATLEPWERAFAAQVARCEYYWETREPPEYVVNEDFEEGSGVYIPDPKSIPIWWDSTSLGELVGYLGPRVRRGRKLIWTLRSREEQELVSREKNLKKADEGQFAISRGKFFPNPHPITDNEHWINSSKDLQEYYNLKDKEAGGLALLNA